MQKKILKVFSTCIPVKGIIRSIVYDLGRSDYFLIPNSLFNVLNSIKNNKFTIQDLKKKHQKLPYTVLDEYLDFLYDNEIIFEIPQNINSNFIDLNINWDHPSDISSIVVLFDFFNESKLERLAKNISINTLCEHCCFISKSSLTKNEIKSILQMFNDSKVRTIEIICKYDKWIEEITNRNTLLQTSGRIKGIIMFGASKSAIFPENENSALRFSKFHDTFKDIMKTKIDYGYFQVNTLFFVESQMHNIYYNRKIFLDIEGDIYLTGEMKTKIGNIIDIADLKRFLNIKTNINLWNSCKDKTDICCNCEFRYMCIDNRIPRTRPDGSFYFQNECNYNPFIAKWEGEKEFKNLCDIGIITGIKGVSINDKQYNNAIKSIYYEL